MESKADDRTVHELQRALEELKQEASTADVKAKEVVRLTDVVASLDEERDQLTAELDQQAEVVDELRQRVADLQTQLSRTDTSASFSKREVIRLSQAVDGRDRQIQSLMRQLDAAKATTEQARQRTTDTQRELAAAAEDLMAMTRENQVVSAEVAALRADKTSLEQHAHDTQQQLHAMQLRLTEIETDKSELLVVYQAVCDERKHLATEVESAAHIRQRLEEQTAQLSSEAGNLRAALAAEQERRDVAERAFASMQASLEQTTRQMAERLHGRPVEGKSTSEILTQASEFGAELDRHRQAMAVAMDQTTHNLHLLMEAKADAEAARAATQAAQLEREAAVNELHHLRQQYTAMEDVAREEKLAHAEAQVLTTALQAELATLRQEFSALSLHADSSHMPGRSDVAVDDTVASLLPLGATGAGAGTSGGSATAAHAAAPRSPTDKATAAAFAAMAAENKSLKADLRQALARLRRADEALGRSAGRVGGGEVLEGVGATTNATATSSSPSPSPSPSPARSGSATASPAGSTSGVDGDTSAAATSLELVTSMDAGRRGSRPPHRSGDRRGTDWAAEFQLLEVELRAVTARCEALEATIRRQAETIRAFQAERQRARRHLLRYEAEVKAQQELLLQHGIAPRSRPQ